MKRAYLLAILIFLFALVTLLGFRHLEAARRVKLAKQLYTQAVENLARSISLSHFQRNRLFRAVLEEDFEAVQAELESLKRNYPIVEDVKIVNSERVDFEFFDVSASGTKLLFRFKIYNDEVTDHVPGKIALAAVDGSELAEFLTIECVEIATSGKDFVYGLKYRFSRSVLFFESLHIAFVLAAAGTFVVLFAFTEKQLDLQKRFMERERNYRNVLSAIIELSRMILSEGNLEGMYQTILEKAIEVIPNAQAGSILVKKQNSNSYVYVAAVGYDLKELSRVVFPVEDIFRWVKGTSSIKRKSDVVSYERHIDDEMFKILQKTGRLDEIMCSLNFAIEVEGEILVQLNLENFEREDAFNEETIELANLFANHLGLLISRLRSQEKILQQERMMEYLSNHDALTGLANRRLFQDYGEKMISLARREQKSTAVLFIDLSKFKIVNDSYGHTVGDEVLKIVGSRLERIVRESDVVARFGGDEFVALVYDCTLSNLNKLTERIIKDIEEPIEIDGKTFKISAEIGVSVYPTDGESLDELVRLADVSMYEAKRRGVKVMFYRELKKEVH
ncbi:sensor domain-containing diguanylate cyclase [Thermotoga sp. Ku-13t]|uniref:sensor domain-containing diguanylate cyclase n=1 Tax=Thermotoga sp. Ku-13t TaxID=1755813 RepID=UPI0013EDE573|nr:sensor domain-containing diguanylate cyclase [Thermotoga sp. Ku-13t]